MCPGGTPRNKAIRLLIWKIGIEIGGDWREGEASAAEGGEGEGRGKGREGKGSMRHATERGGFKVVTQENPSSSFLVIRVGRRG